MLEKSHSGPNHVHLTNRETLDDRRLEQTGSSSSSLASDLAASRLERPANSGQMEAVRAAGEECLASEA